MIHRVGLAASIVRRVPAFSVTEIRHLQQSQVTRHRQDVASIAVGTESLAAGFATGDDYTRTAECHRRLPLDERAPNVPFKLGLRVR
jgi:hypothetical protein